MNLLTTITLNPCLDKTVSIDSFTYGGMNRIVDSRIDVAGKGINVALAYRNLGGRVLCSGINYREGAGLVTDFLEEKEIAHDFVLAEGSLRINHKIYDRSKRVITELNDRGYPVEVSIVDNIKKKIVELAKKSRIIVLSGSVPEGIPDSIYLDILKLLSKYNIKTVLDAEGSLLEKGILGKPYLIKPNLFELEKLIGRKLDSLSDIVTAGRTIISQGVKLVCVSLGDNGAIILDDKETFYSPGLELDVKGTAGAGDSMIGGVCRAFDKGLELADILRYGVATATGSVMREGSLVSRKEDFEFFLPKIKIKKLQ